MKRYVIKVAGNVQGVFFRSSARDTAARLGLAGFARNEPDGSVYIEAEGDEAALQEFLVWCHEGPPQAAVQKVTKSESQPFGYTGFAIY